MKRHRWYARAARGVAFFIVMTVLLSVVVMLLWNALLPGLFNVPVIGFWQALGLFVLSHILFRGWGGWRGHAWRHERWRRHFEDRIAAMTPEEREKFKSEWRRRCGWRWEEEGDKDTKAPA